jgi:LysM repeat protein
MAFFHTVQPGETLFSISKKYNVAVEAIRDLNKLGTSDIRAGMQLIINPNQPALDEKEEAVVPGYHTVRQGETWYAIARRYNTQVAQLKALNPHQGDTLHIGDELVVVPMNGEKAPQEAVSTDPSEVVYHLVREKETMYSITRKYNVEASQIRRLNDLLDNTVYVGQRLRIR